MTLPLLMDLANYRVSGAAPRLLRPRQNEMRRNRGSENIQISNQNFLWYYFIDLLCVWVTVIGILKPSNDFRFIFWFSLNPWFLNWLLAYAWSDIHHLHERRWYRPVKDRRQQPIVKIVKIGHDSPGHYQKPSWNREKCVNKQLSEPGVIIIIPVVMTQV